MFHPNSKLRFHHAEIWLGYDGSIRVATNAQVLAPDGTDTELRHGWTHRVSPHHPHWRYLAEALRPAVKAHHEALGLQFTDDHLPIHLHPQGHPAFPPAALEELPAVPLEEIRDHIVAAKEAELGTTIPPAAHPSLEEQP